MRDCIEVLFLLKEDLASILLPIVSEVVIDFPLEAWVNVEATAIGLVLDTTDKIEPLLELLFVLALVLTLDGDDDILELVHENREEGDSEDLNDATEYFLHDRAGAVITIADSR